MLTAVVGGAACVLEDLADLRSIAEPDTIIAINDIGAELEHVDVWCTLHMEKMKMWLSRREEHGLPPVSRIAFGVSVPERFLTSYGYPSEKVIIEHNFDFRGGSGFFAAMLAQSLFRGPVVLCGVPMEAVWSHFFDDKPWYDAQFYQSEWAKNLDKLIPRVRSMSGWTAKVLGRPDTSWIAQKEKEVQC